MLRVLTLNAWDLPFSTDLKPRIDRICDIFEKNDSEPVLKPISKSENNADAVSPIPERGFDIISLQEVFMASDRKRMLRAATKGGLLYSHFFEAGIGFPAIPEAGHPSGLLIISRYPIVDVSYHRYTLNGQPHKLLHWDYYIAKGVGLTRVLSPHGLIDVYNTHLIAFYTQTAQCVDEYESHRATQALECADWMRQWSQLDTPIHTHTQPQPRTLHAGLALLMGDLNSTPCSLPVQTLTTLVGMRDALAEATHNDKEDDSTWTCNANMYAEGAPRRVDYVLYRTGEVARWLLRDCFTCLRDPVAGMHVSDHCGVAAEFELVDTHTHAHTHTSDSVVTHTQAEEGNSHKLSDDADRILRKIMMTVPEGMLQSRWRQRQHYVRLVLFPVVLVMLSLFTRLIDLSPWWLVVSLPLLSVVFAIDVFLGVIHCNEEQSALSAAWNALAVRLGSNGTNAYVKYTRNARETKVMDATTALINVGLIDETDDEVLEEVTTQYSRNFTVWGSITGMVGSFMRVSSSAEQKNK